QFGFARLRLGPCAQCSRSFAACLLDQARSDQTREQEGQDHHPVLRLGHPKIKNGRGKKEGKRRNSDEGQETRGQEAGHQREQQDYYEITEGSRGKVDLKEKAGRSHHRQRKGAEEELRGWISELR